MFEINDIVTLKNYHNKYTFYKITKVDGMIEAKNLDGETEAYFTADEIEKATLGALLNYCKETKQVLYIDTLYKSTVDKLKTIGDYLKKTNKDFDYTTVTVDESNYYFFFKDNSELKIYQNKDILKVFELDIDIDSTYHTVLYEIEIEKNKIKTKEEGIKEKVEDLKKKLTPDMIIQYKNNTYLIPYICGDNLVILKYSKENDTFNDPEIITFEDYAKYLDSQELHLEDHIIDYSKEIKMNTLSAISVDNVNYCINDKCSTCKNEEYITRDEAKKLVEEMFERINNKENKEMEFNKTMNDKTNEEIEKVKASLYGKLAAILATAGIEKKEPEKTEGKPLSNLNEKYGDLLDSKYDDMVEAIYINADKKVIVLKWKDGETTKAVCDPQDKFDIEAGVFLALAKRNYYYEEIAEMCDWEGITSEMEKGIFFSLAQEDYSVAEIKRYVNWAKKIYNKQTKKVEQKPKTNKKVK